MKVATLALTAFLVISALLLGACGKEAKPSAAPPASGSAEEAEPTAVEPEQAKPAPAVVSPASATEAAPGSDASKPSVAGDCVPACVRRNQMRAVAAEVIDSDCRRECAAAKP